MTRTNKQATSAVTLTLLLTSMVGVPLPADAQMKKRMMQIAFCAGGALGGYKLGEKAAEFYIRKAKVPPEQARQYIRSFQIGMALALCGGGALVSGTVYDRMSKRDKEARDREMQDALAAADPGTREYVLPDSNLQGKITSEPMELEDDGRECRTMVDVLADSNEPARARYCRKPGGKFELDL